MQNIRLWFSNSICPFSFIVRSHLNGVHFINVYSLNTKSVCLTKSILSILQTVRSVECSNTSKWHRLNASVYFETTIGTVASYLSNDHIISVHWAQNVGINFLLIEFMANRYMPFIFIHYGLWCLCNVLHVVHGCRVNFYAFGSKMAYSLVAHSFP